MSYGWTDILCHVILLPLYFYLEVWRHELSHWLFLKLGGYKGIKISVIPKKTRDTIMWGSYSCEGSPGFHVCLAPYYVGIILTLLWVLLQFTIKDWASFHFWAVTTIFLGLSPTIDFLGNLQLYLRKKQGDFADAFYGPA